MWWKAESFFLRPVFLPYKQNNILLFDGDIPNVFIVRRMPAFHNFWRINSTWLNVTTNCILWSKVLTRDFQMTWSIVCSCNAFTRSTAGGHSIKLSVLVRYADFVSPTSKPFEIPSIQCAFEVKGRMLWNVGAEFTCRFYRLTGNHVIIGFSIVKAIKFWNMTMCFLFFTSIATLYVRDAEHVWPESIQCFNALVADLRSWRALTVIEKLWFEKQ